MIWAQQRFLTSFVKDGVNFPDYFNIVRYGLDKGFDLFGGPVWLRISRFTFHI